VRRIPGTGDFWVTELFLAYDGQPSYSVSIMEFLDGKVARETQHFGDPFEPSPSRTQWVERMGGIGATIARYRVLDRAELPIATAQLARFLIGKILVRILAEGVSGGRIVETEAYGIGDPAGHAYGGMTPRNRTLFLERGHAYVYLAYGNSFMLNVSSETTGVGAGVLIRAIEPTEGIATMIRNRNTNRLRDLARGPGRLSAALGIDRRLDGIDLCQRGPLWLGSDGQVPGAIGQSKRIGITRATDSPLRFFVRGNQFISGPRALNR
jgi:DNA-3-methyladenine glycosylase